MTLWKKFHKVNSPDPATSPPLEEEAKERMREAGEHHGRGMEKLSTEPYTAIDPPGVKQGGGNKSIRKPETSN